MNLDILENDCKLVRPVPCTDGIAWISRAEGTNESTPTCTFAPLSLQVFGNPVVVTASSEELIDNYETLLAASMFFMGCSNTAVSRCLSWLRNTDFYTAPASTQYHEAYPAGLLQHTLKTYNASLQLATMPIFQTVSYAEMVFSVLVHDWCKIGMYESYEKNVKVDGQWTVQIAYRVNQKTIPLGHGATSMFLASRFVPLTTDVALAIRWHMGEYRVCDQEMNELHLANENVPLVQLVQFADRLAIVDYE